MNPSLDTLQISIPNFSSHLIDMDTTQFRLKDDEYQGVKKSNLVLETRQVGVSIFKYTPESDTALLKVSAKVLGDDYFEGINLKTLDRFARSFNGSNFSIKPSWIDDAYVQSVDVTKNLKPADIKKAISDLNLLGLNHHYKISSYRSSVIFDPKAKGDNSRIQFYDKTVELMTAKNKSFIKTLSPKTVNQFLGVLRCERNIRNFADIRESFAVDDLKLLDVLSSKEKPCLNMFNKITKVQLPLFSVNSAYASYHKWTDIEKAYGMDRIIQDCNYDLDVIMIAVRQYVKGNPSRYRAKYRERIAVLKASNSESSLTKSLEEILYQLAV